MKKVKQKKLYPKLNFFEKLNDKQREYFLLLMIQKIYNECPIKLSKLAQDQGEK